VKKYLLFLCSFASFKSFAQDVKITKGIMQAMDRIDTNIIRSHIVYLADDKLKGRLPGTEGYQMALDYVIEQYKKMGLQPAGDNNGFIQKLILRKAILNNSSAVAILKDKKGNTDSLIFIKDFTPVPHPFIPQTTADAQLVFVGYGVEIPGGYSDYNNIDVKGKIVVFINGVPGGLPSTLAAHFSSAGNKMNIAYAKGAAGIINAASMSRPIPENPNPVFQLNVALNPEKTAAYGRGFTGKLKVVLNATYPMLRKLFMNSGRNYEEVVAGLKKGVSSSFELPYSIYTSYSSVQSEVESYNIAGLIAGSDKVLKSEYVVHSAHLDHLGIGKVVNGDSIYNGAHDNASGVASLLEIARVYKTSGAKPRRSVLILMVTGEEMGLLGSSYFAANPTVPKSSIVAAINTDMPTIIAPLLSVVPLGAEHSSLKNNVNFAAKYLGVDVEKDPEPTENRFVRSDQYSFVMSGIPALHIKYGTKSDIPGFDLIAFVKEWRAKHYHQPADGIDGIFNFTGAKTFVQANFLVSYSIAQTTARPKWNAGDLFGTSSAKAGVRN